MRVAYDGVAVYLLSGLLSFQAMQFMRREADNLCIELNDVDTMEPVPKQRSISQLKLVLAFIVVNCSVPFVALWNFVFDNIEWSNIVYTKKSGRVVKVAHNMRKQACL